MEASLLGMFVCPMHWCASLHYVYAQVRSAHTYGRTYAHYLAYCRVEQAQHAVSVQQVAVLCILTVWRADSQHTPQDFMGNGSNFVHRVLNKTLADALTTQSGVALSNTNSLIVYRML